MERFCGHSNAIKIDLKLTGKPFPGRTLWPSDPDVNYHFAKFSHAQQETFQDSFFGLKVTQQSPGLFLLQAMFKSNRGTVSGYFLAGRFMTFLPVSSEMLL